jgi:hypothetical protein
MRVLYDVGAIFAPILKLFGGGGSQPQYFNTGPNAAQAKAQEEKAAQDAKNKSLADAAGRQGAASSLITAADSGADFAGLKTRKTLLGGA